MVIRNYMEHFVVNLMPDVIQNIDMCDCEHCKMDVMAITLNNVKPKYIVTDKGELYAKLSSLQSQFQADVVTEITKACVTVASNPRH